MTVAYIWVLDLSLISRSWCAMVSRPICDCRKKHPMREGQRLEDAIGYTRFATELGADSTLRSMLETVCKFCGEDFKFYRALKHHLRSQTSCQYKPCQCKVSRLHCLYPKSKLPYFCSYNTYPCLICTRCIVYEVL